MFNNYTYLNEKDKVINAAEKAKAEVLKDFNFKLQSHFQGELFDYWSKVKAEIELL